MGRQARAPGSMRLVYELNRTANGFDGDVNQRVLEILKRRVDPDGVRNSSWQIRGNNQLEVQIPLSAQTKEGILKRAEACLQAWRVLEQTNIRREDVEKAIATLDGDARKEALEKLAQGNLTSTASCLLR